MVINHRHLNVLGDVEASALHQHDAGEVVQVAGETVDLDLGGPVRRGRDDPLHGASRAVVGRASIAHALPAIGEHGRDRVHLQVTGAKDKKALAHVFAPFHAGEFVLVGRGE